MKKVLLGLTALVATQAQGLCGGKRSFDIDKGNDKIKVNAKTRDKEAKCKDDLEIKFELGGDGAAVRFDYKASAADAKSKFHVRQNVFRVVEFDDKNSNNVIDEGEEVQTLALDKWNAITEKSVDQEGEKVYTWKASSEAGWFKVSTRYAGAPVTYLALADAGEAKKVNYELRPSAFKIDYILENFPYKNDGTKVALDGRFKSKAKFQQKRKKEDRKRADNKEEQEIETADDTGMGARFSWITTVSADGTDVPVVAYDKSDPDEKVAEGESNKRLVWVFDTTTKVTKFVWDPELGANEGSSASAAAVTGTLLAALLLFA
jgi:hypothetical protein